jgi:hypothetical protein
MLTRKPRSDSALNRLSADQQNRLLRFISEHGYAKGIEFCAKLPPEGFGLKTHLASLKRFYHQHIERAETEKLIDGLTALNGEETIERQIQYLAFSLASSPDAGLKAFRALSNWQLSRREHELKESYFDLVADQQNLAARPRSETDSLLVRQLLAILRAIQCVVANSSLSSDQKVEQIRAMFASQGIPATGLA